MKTEAVHIVVLRSQRVNSLCNRLHSNRWQIFCPYSYAIKQNIPL